MRRITMGCTDNRRCYQQEFAVRKLEVQTAMTHLEGCLTRIEIAFDKAMNGQGDVSAALGALVSLMEVMAPCVDFHPEVDWKLRSTDGKPSLVYWF